MAGQLDATRRVDSMVARREGSGRVGRFVARRNGGGLERHLCRDLRARKTRTNARGNRRHRLRLGLLGASTHQSALANPHSRIRTHQSALTTRLHNGGSRSQSPLFRGLGPHQNTATHHVHPTTKLELPMLALRWCWRCSPARSSSPCSRGTTLAGGDRAAAWPTASSSLAPPFRAESTESTCSPAPHARASPSTGSARRSRSRRGAPETQFRS